MNLATIRDGLKTRLATISGLRAYDTVPADIRLPAAVVAPGDPYVDYDLTFGGGTTVRFVVRVYAAKPSETRAQDKLDAYASDGSGGVYFAIESDGTLGGSVDSTHVERAKNFGVTAVAGVDYLTIDFDVECLTS